VLWKGREKDGKLIAFCHVSAILREPSMSVTELSLYAENEA